QPVYTIQDERTNITFFSDVRIPDRYRLGEVNGGLHVMMATMELEHGGDQYRISYKLMFDHALAWAKNTRRNGQRVIDDISAGECLARSATHTTVAKALCDRAIWDIEEQVPNRAHFGPMSKVFSTEFSQRDAIDLMDLCAPESLLASHHGLGHVEIGYRQS